MTDNAAVDRGDDFTPTGTDAEQNADTTIEEGAKAEGQTDVTSADEGKTDDAKAEGKDDSDGDKPRDDKGRFIPKERFDEAVKKERSEKEQLQARLKEFEEKEAQRNVAADFAEAQKQIREMIKQHTSLLADGELDKASDLMEKILEMQSEIADRKAEAKALAAKDRAKEEVRYDATVARLEADYPQINPDAEEFDKAAVRRVQAYMTGLMQTERMSPSQALKEAVETILGPVKKADTAADKKTEDLSLRRKEEAVRKAMDAKSKQPASTKDVGLDHDKQGGPMDASAVMKMSWEEFVKLPESKLAELRGDFVS